MVDSPEPMEPEAQGQASKGAVAPRRRFLQQGLAGGSILLLASTRHAIAKGSKGGSCGTSKLTKSGHQSAVANAHTSASGKKFCAGRSPGYWVPPGNPTQRLTSWPAGCTKTTTFKSKFGVNPGSGFATTATLYTILSHTPDTPERQFCAAYLDAAGGVSDYPYTVAQVVAIWKSQQNIAAYVSYFSGYLNVA